MNGEAPVVRLAGLTHRYGTVQAADGVDLEIPAGRMVGFIGPDGVGKSTWLGLIAGARQIQQGRVEVLGGDMAAARHREAVCPRIAYMPQGLGHRGVGLALGDQRQRGLPGALCVGHLGAGLGQLGVDGAGVHAGDDLAGLHEVAFVHQDLGDPAGELGGHVHLDRLNAPVARHEAAIVGGRAELLPGQERCDQGGGQ